MSCGIYKSGGSHMSINEQNIATSIRDLARKMNRSDMAIRKWMKKDNWVFSMEGPWKVDEVKIWSEKFLEKEYGPGEVKISVPGETTLTRARIESTIEKTMLTKIHRLAAEGKLIDAEEAQRIRLKQIHEIKGVLLSFPRLISNLLVGKSRDQIEEILLERIENIINEFAGIRQKNTDMERSGTGSLETPRTDAT